MILGQSSAGAGSGLTSKFNSAGQISWAPPLLGYSNQQIFDGNSLQNNGGNIITSLLLFGLYMSIPNVSEMIKKFLEVASPFKESMTKTGGDVTDVGKRALGYAGSGIAAISGKIFGGGGK